MRRLNSLRTKLFADGADVAKFVALAADPLIKGFTTNPTLMRNMGVANYETFARDLLAAIPDRPISFEVLADDFAEMNDQAREIASWGPNVYVKVPVTDTRRQPAADLIHGLSRDGIRVNVTAILSLEQVRHVVEWLSPETPSVVSVFAGRVADTGVDPVPLMAEAASLLASLPRAELLWASPREILNVFQADAVGCHIITLTGDLLAKLSLVGKDLNAYSLETVEMFHRDALAAGYTIGGSRGVAASADISVPSEG